MTNIMSDGQWVNSSLYVRLSCRAAAVRGDSICYQLTTVTLFLLQFFREVTGIA
jgi:hypothetical protein